MNVAISSSRSAATHEPVVVVGVLTDEVHPSRRHRGVLRRAVEVLAEQVAGALNEPVETIVNPHHAMLDSPEAAGGAFTSAVSLSRPGPPSNRLSHAIPFPPGRSAAENSARSPLLPDWYEPRGRVKFPHGREARG